MDSKTIKLFSTVRLKDGREGDVVDVYSDPPGYEIDFTRAGQPVPDPLTEGVEAREIAEVLWEPKD